MVHQTLICPSRTLSTTSTSNFSSRLRCWTGERRKGQGAQSSKPLRTVLTKLLVLCHMGSQMYRQNMWLWQTKPNLTASLFHSSLRANVLCVLIDHPFTISQSPQIYHTTAILLLIRGMEFGVSETRVMKNGCLVNANNMLGM